MFHFFRSDQSPETRTYCITDGTPEYLSDELRVCWKGCVGNAELCSSRFSKDDVVGFEEVTETLPEVGLFDFTGFESAQNWWLCML
jgi:hypothetical protein